MIKQSEGFFERIRIVGHPVASAQNVIVCGQARFTVLTSRLIRLEWAENARFEDRATFAFPQRYGDAVAVAQIRDETGVELKTDDMTLRYRDDGRPFHGDNLSIELRMAGETVTWTPGLPDSGNLHGTRRTLDQCAGEANLQPGLLSRDGWSLFDDSGSVVWDEDQIWVEARPSEHVQDWYFFGYGHDYKQLLKDYVQFGGPIPLAPRYVLGAWWSRFWAYSDRDLMALVGDFQARDIPLDVLVVDMDWHTTDGWTGYTWNRELFPDPEAFLAWVHSQNLFVTLNLHPADGVKKHEEAYQSFAERIGHDSESGEGIAFRGADKGYIQSYFELLHHPMEEQGVDFWWLDWQQGTSTELKNLDPLPWLNHLHFQDSTRRGTRPMLYSRWGGLGNHRYPIGFSGDTYATWAALAFLPYFTATAANVGYGWWSHDIGGHFGPTEPELYARWVQFGAISPCLRLHSTKDPLAERRPWGFPEPVYAAAKAAIQFRYQLFPYLYSAARHASEQGLSLSMPLYYEYPEAADAYLARGQYFLGDQMIAAPIVTPSDPQTGLATFDVWIPEGRWYNFKTAEAYSGPQWVRLAGDLDAIPLFVKAGGIIPMAENLKQTSQFDGSRVVVVVFPGAEGDFELYEDDGLTTAYRQGEYETTTVSTRSMDDGSLNVTISPAHGHCASLSDRRSFELRIRSVGRPAEVFVNQTNENRWRYDPASGDLVIAIDDVNRSTEQNVTVRFVGGAALRPAAVSERAAEPFVHYVDYGTFADARQQLGAIVVVPPADHAPFDVEVTWGLTQRGVTTETEPVRLHGCRSEQILDCPFHDDGSCATFRWSVIATIEWQGVTIHERCQSADAYPAISQWEMSLYNREQQPTSIEDVRPGVNRLQWQSIRQVAETSVNLNQPFGVTLLEQEGARIRAKEPLEACLRTTLVRDLPQAAVLYVQSVGDGRCYLNGIELSETEPAVHAPFEPMFYSWMPVCKHFYAVTLPEGESDLVIFTQPDYASGFWGVGATLLDVSGAVLP